MSRRKIMRYRGGFRVPPSTRSRIASAGRSAASSLWRKHRPAVMRGLKAAIGEQAASALNLGIEMYHNLSVGTGGKPAPLIGAEIKNSGSFSVTESHYRSRPKRKPSKALVSAMSMGQRIEFVCDGNYRVASNATLQGVADPTYSSGFTTNNYHYVGAFFNGNTTYYSGSYLSRNGALETIAEAATGSEPTSRLLFKNCRVETLLTNLGQASCVIDVYELVARHDAGVFYFSDGNALSPASYWSTGLANNSSPETSPAEKGGGQLTCTVQGALPTASMLFNTFWKVCSKMTITIPAGGGHRHLSDYNLMKVLTPMRWGVSTLLQGVTRSHLYVIRGMPGYDLTTSEYGPLAPSECAIKHSIRYTAYSLPHSEKISFYARTTNSVSSDTIKGQNDADAAFGTQSNN